MKLTADEIQDKAMAGKTKDGRPVVYIATKGGLHAFFCKDEDGQIMSIAAAPHKAIAKFMAGKKEKIDWDKDFEQGSDTIKKNEAELFNKLRQVMFMDRVDLPDAVLTKSDTFLIYDVRATQIEVVKKNELEENIRAGKIDRYALVRDLNLSSRATCIQDHEDFEEFFER